jgi:hypothetical protein
MKRSLLLRPEPLGIGTGEAESLRSYICRLARLHFVTPVQLIWELVPELRLKNGGARKCHLRASACNSHRAWLTCSSCSHDHSQSRNGKAAGLDALWTAQQVSKMIASGFDHSPIQRERVSQIWNKVIFPSFSTKSEARRMLNLSKPVVDMANSGHRFTFPLFLGICRNLSLDLDDVLTGNLSHLKPVVKICSKRMPRRKIPSIGEIVKRVERALVTMPKENQSLRALARAAQIGTARFRREFPELAEKLVQDRSCQRREASKLRREKYVNIVSAIIAREGPSVSSWRIIKLSGISMFPRMHPWLKEARRKALELSTPNP